ncbi:MAG: ABC transporter permease [Anaerolineales bacterium]|nr:ABC transporter permease [Anaerolineales bacterium]
MLPFFQFVLRRFLVIPISLFVITLVIYGGVTLTPPEARADLYMPKNFSPYATPERIAKIKELIIQRHHLRDPFPVQYFYWVQSLLNSTWGYSPSMKEEVLPALLQRTPVTLELTLWSMLVIFPLGTISGLMAGWKRQSRFDQLFRGLASFASSMPTIILSLVLLSVFYINLGWFAPGRISTSLAPELLREGFASYTGMLTIDSLLNGRVDIFIDVLKHLVMPVFTLSLYYWATLGRVTRANVMSERNKGYVNAAYARGLSDQGVIWKHVYPNILPPSLVTLALSATSILTGAFVVEIIFNFNGVSHIIVSAMNNIPDAPAALGFTVYSVIMVLLLTFLLDVLQALFDPRVREGVIHS